MREVLYAIGLLFLLGLVTVIVLLDPVQVMGITQTVMLWSVAVALPFELLYFVGLARAVQRQPQRPKGWYWRSFEHHQALGPRERWPVLICFAIGSSLMLIASLGVVVAVAAVLATLRPST